MDVRAPYLFGGTGSAARGQVTATGDVDTAVVELAVHGRWSERLRVDVCAGVRKCLAGQPAAVIADLHHLGDRRAASVAMWLGARRAGTTLHPPVPLLLSLPPTVPLADRIRRLPGRPRVPMFDTMEQARQAVAERATSQVRQLRLPPDVSSPSAARNLVGAACHSWGRSELLHPARLIISELVSNVVEHAGTEMLVTISHRGSRLHLSVRDGSPQLPQLCEPAPVRSGRPLDERGQGLRLVHAGASAWGSMPTRDGKVVWATVRAPADHES